MHTDRPVWFTWLTKIDFVSALPGKLGAVILFLLVSMLQVELQKYSVFLNKVRGCRDIHAQNLKKSILFVRKEVKSIKQTKKT